MRLEMFGWNLAFSGAFKSFRTQGHEPGRVRLARPQSCILMTDHDDVEVTVAGRLQQPGIAERPVVGDWVAFAPQSRRIEAFLPRMTQIARRRPGPKPDPQVMAANLDVLIVVSAFGRDFNLRRMERYLLLARQSGAEPVLVVNKLDECIDPAAVLRQIRPIADGAPVVLMSAVNAVGLDELLGLITPRQTAALLGSSGVGKSTIINRLLGEERQRTGAISDQSHRGQHTTTERELLLLPGGQLLIDTPGLRELQLWAPAESFDASFLDITKLAGHCRFRDCGHRGEPGCAVQAASASGEIDPGRLENYHRIQRELRHLERQTDQRAAVEERQRIKRIHRQYRKMPHRK